MSSIASFLRLHDRFRFSLVSKLFGKAAFSATSWKGWTAVCLYGSSTLSLEEQARRFFHQTFAPLQITQATFNYLISFKCDIEELLLATQPATKLANLRFLNVDNGCLSYLSKNEIVEALTFKGCILSTTEFHRFLSCPKLSKLTLIDNSIVGGYFDWWVSRNVLLLKSITIEFLNPMANGQDDECHSVFLKNISCDKDACPLLEDFHYKETISDFHKTASFLRRSLEWEDAKLPFFSRHSKLPPNLRTWDVRFIVKGFIARSSFQRLQQRRRLTLEEIKSLGHQPSENGFFFSITCEERIYVSPRTLTCKWCFRHVDTCACENESESEGD